MAVAVAEGCDRLLGRPLYMAASLAISIVLVMAFSKALVVAVRVALPVDWKAYANVCNLGGNSDCNGSAAEIALAVKTYDGGQEKQSRYIPPTMAVAMVLSMMATLMLSTAILMITKMAVTMTHAMAGAIAIAVLSNFSSGCSASLHLIAIHSNGSRNDDFNGDVHGDGSGNNINDNSYCGLLQQSYWQCDCDCNGGCNLYCRLQ
eukprot:6175413-Pleurochrysis_carterae.AAC.1